MSSQASPSSPVAAVARPALALPVLGEVPHGRYSLGVPVNNNNVQIGFSGTPDAKDRLDLVVDADRIVISRASGEPLQIESGVMEGDGPPQERRLVRRRVLAGPVPALTLERSGAVWEADTALHDDAMRVELSRFAAKVGDAALKKAKHGA
jgi:hypothetical protein